MPAQEGQSAAKLGMRGVGIDGSLSQSAATAVPFGGTKRSGVGRELGRSGRDRFASIKSYGILSPPSPDARPPRESQPMPHPQPPSQDHETSRLGL
jgi:hypothetical protein